VIEEFRFNNEGTTSVSIRQNGLKVDLAYQFVHLFCRYDKDRFVNAPLYFFAYLTKIEVDEESKEKFKACVLTDMTEIIKDENNTVKSHKHIPYKNENTIFDNNKNKHAFIENGTQI